MVTLGQALGLGYRGVVHLNGCSRVVGVRGGVVERVRVYRVNGVVKTWKKDVGRWEVPIVWGLRGWDKLSNGNAGWFHVAGECPLLRNVRDDGDAV
jgi:hypothetical protein